MARKPSRYSTTSEAEIRALVAEGLNFVQIAEKLNLNIIALRQVGCVLGITSAYRRDAKRRHFDLDAWVQRLERGASLQEIANDEGITREYVNQTLRKAGRPTCMRAAVKAKCAAVAQSAEHPTCKGQVGGSMPSGGSISAQA